MTPSLDLSTPFLPPTLRPFLQQLADDSRSGKPSQWYQELEDLCRQVPLRDWQHLYALNRDLTADWKALKAHVDETTAKGTQQQSEVELLERMRLQILAAHRGVIRESFTHMQPSR